MLGSILYFSGFEEFRKLTDLNAAGTHGFPRLMVYIFLGYFIAVNVNRFNGSAKSYLVMMLLAIILFTAENLIIWKLGGSSNSQEVITSVPTGFLVSVFSLKYVPKISSTIILRKFSTFLYCIQAWPMWILGHFFNTAAIINQLIVFALIILFAGIFFELYKLVQKKTQWKFWSYMV